MSTSRSAVGDQDGPGAQVGRLAVLLSALAHDGLVFASGAYDVDRYQKIARIAEDLLAAISGHAGEEIHQTLGLDGGYVTPKVDVRGALFDDQDRVLLMRERADGRWSLPGGWADPGDSPALAVEREMLEESGYPVKVIKLVGCWDRDRQGHRPPMSVAVYKLFFLCEQTAPSRAPDALETLEIGWFDLADLPQLSTGRVLPHQLRVLRDHHHDRSLATAFE